jgi:hypothetical protein
MTETDPDRRSVAFCGGISGSAAITQRRHTMFAGLAFLALFSVLSILLGREDPRPGADPGNDPLFWAHFGVH